MKCVCVRVCIIFIVSHTYLTIYWSYSCCVRPDGLVELFMMCLLCLFMVFELCLFVGVVRGV